MIYLELFLAFLRVGLFSFGGGLAALPLIEREVTSWGWLSHREFLELVTLSEMTPGPIAINSATFTGFKVGGMGGAFLATRAFCLPSYLGTPPLSFSLPFSRNSLGGTISAGFTTGDSRPAFLGGLLLSIAGHE